MRPAVAVLLGVGVTLALPAALSLFLLATGGAQAISGNAALVGALVALGGVLTTQLVGMALETGRGEEANLRSYVDLLAERLADPDRPLHRTTPSDAIGLLVHAQTLAVAAGLTDPSRKRKLVRILYDSGLIGAYRPLIDLTGADLSRADLGGGNLFLEGINLRQAYLDQANLASARMTGADLSGIRAWHVNMREAELSCANLADARLQFADLRAARLTDKPMHVGPRGTDPVERPANLHAANLEDANLEGANLTRANLTGTRLHRSNLRGASFAGAEMVGTILMEADLRPRRGKVADSKLTKYGYLFDGTNLDGAILWKADLRGSNLSKARGLTQEQIERAVGHPQTTKLPKDLTAPRHWRGSVSSQKEAIGPFSVSADVKHRA